MHKWYIGLIVGVIGFVSLALGAQNGLPDEIASYLSWHRGNSQKSFEESAHPVAKDIYFNDTAAETVMAQSFPHAEGSTFLKERTDPETLMVTTIYGMRKVANFDPANGDWQYAVFERADDGKFLGDWMEASSATMCIGCHTGAKDKDYTFLSYLDN
ncbi:MAG: cytochrome P460 family protein [Trueperaceae bacterium]|nr:cytochrome P460 family protein [Trueperaceae bacterium]